METADPSIIESVAVHRKDIVRAYEMRAREQAPAVLRMTPPFSERMRGRLHIADRDPYTPGTENAPIHVPPAALVSDPPTFPTPDATADQLRADADRTYTPETHHDFHSRQVAQWRAQIADSIVPQVVVSTAQGDRTISVVTLGDWPPDEPSISER